MIISLKIYLIIIELKQTQLSLAKYGNKLMSYKSSDFYSSFFPNHYTFSMSTDKQQLFFM